MKQVFICLSSTRKARRKNSELAKKPHWKKKQTKKTLIQGKRLNFENSNPRGGRKSILGKKLKELVAFSISSAISIHNYSKHIST